MQKPVAIVTGVTMLGIAGLVLSQQFGMGGGISTKHLKGDVDPAYGICVSTCMLSCANDSTCLTGCIAACLAPASTTPPPPPPPPPTTFPTTPPPPPVPATVCTAAQQSTLPICGAVTKPCGDALCGASVNCCRAASPRYLETTVVWCPTGMQNAGQTCANQSCCKAGLTCLATGVCASIFSYTPPTTACNDMFCCAPSQRCTITGCV